LSAITAPVARRPAGRLVAGDPLRGLAALSVVLYHVFYDGALLNGRASYAAAYPLLPWPILRNLDLGLYVFFVLSGYLVAGPFIRSVADRARLPRTLAYLGRRGLRIVPLFWVVFTALYLRHVLLPDGVRAHLFQASPLELASIYAFAQSYLPSVAALLVGQAWTLDVEAAFYVLLPAVGLALWLTAGRLRSRRARVRLLLAAAVVIFAASAAARLVGPSTLPWRHSILDMAFAFTPGAALACVELEMDGRTWRRGVAAAVAMGCIGLGLAVLLAYQLWSPSVPSFSSEAPALAAPMAGAGTALLVAAVMIAEWGGAGVARVLDSAPMRWLGKRSYGIYLWHVGVLLELVGLARLHLGATGTALLMLAIGLPVTLVLAEVTYRLVELPCLSLKRFLPESRDRDSHPGGPRRHAGNS
jgi:peptidoglycan/LPS O-acetylase OafA/YrhL